MRKRCRTSGSIPFILVHEGRLRLSDMKGVDTKHPNRGFDNLCAIVTQDEPSETVSDYVPYALRDSVLQPGGCRNRRAVGAAP